MNRQNLPSQASQYNPPPPPQTRQEHILQQLSAIKEVRIIYCISNSYI